MATRYIDPTTDFGFKRLFGRADSSEILKAFLRDLLDLPAPIRELTYLPTAQIPELADERVSIYDVYCIDEQDRRFIVEMQRNWQLHFKARTLYYSTFPIREQVEKGRWNYELLPIYCLSILNFALDGAARYLRRVQLCDTATGSVFYNDLTFVFVELPKFQPRVTELTTDAEKWVYLLQHLSELAAPPAEFTVPPFAAVFAAAEEAALTPAEHMVYEASLKQMRDAKAVEESALWRGRAEGRVEGRAEVARALVARGMELRLVAEVTGLTAAELAAL